MIQLGDLKVDQETYTVTYHNIQLGLTRTEFEIVYCLAQANERPVSYRDLARQLRGVNVDDREARQMFSAHLSNLRAKLRAAGCDAYLVNQRGHGYLLRPPMVVRRIPFAQEVVDSLLVHIAVVDATGTIVAVNKAWRDFADANAQHPDEVCEGADYLAVCDAATGEDRSVAQAFARAIRAAIAGEAVVFAQDYRCQTPTRVLYFMGQVTRFESGGQVYVVVAHENITDSLRTA